MPGIFDKRKKQKLYRQWVEKSGLPPESVPDEAGPENGPEETTETYRETRPAGVFSNVSLRLTMRHVLYLLLIIMVLLVATASMITVLIMRSC